MDNAAEFGVYILTYPGDFHLSTALVESIKEVNPDTPVMIIPGEGFDFDNHPFDVPVMPVPEGFWGKLGHQDRDFWCFQGPFEKFLYLDSDTICVKSLDKLIERVAQQEGDFLYVQQWIDEETWRNAIYDPSHPDYETYHARVRRVFGKGDFSQFDPDVDFYTHYPFNSGVWASRRGMFTEDHVRALHERELSYYKDVLQREFTWKADGVFQRDQGRLNYLACKLNIPRFAIHPEVIALYGGDDLTANIDMVRNDELDYHVIHWTGAPRPSPSFLCRKPWFGPISLLWRNAARGMTKEGKKAYARLSEMPGYSLWRTYYERSQGKMSLSERLHWTRRDITRMGDLSWRLLRDFYYRHFKNENPNAPESGGPTGQPTGQHSA